MFNDYERNPIAQAILEQEPNGKLRQVLDRLAECDQAMFSEPVTLTMNSNIRENLAAIRKLTATKPSAATAGSARQIEGEYEHRRST